MAQYGAYVRLEIRREGKRRLDAALARYSTPTIWNLERHNYGAFWSYELVSYRMDYPTLLGAVEALVAHVRQALPDKALWRAVGVEILSMDESRETMYMSRWMPEDTI